MRRAPLAILLILAGAGVAGADPPHTAVACTLRGAGGTCDHILTPTGFTRFNGLTSNPPVGPGTRICLRAGSYPAGQLWLENLVGDAPDPVEVINCGGRFVISMPDATVRAIDFYGVRYLKLTGSGSPTDHYGIHVAGAVGSGINFQALSSDMEVEYVEISDTGFAGIMAKTDATCTDTDPLSFRGGFVQRNSVFHDNYIHDVEGEGFYIGYSFWQGRTQTCNGTPTLTYSHPLDGVRIYRNRLERTGCEAIQVGCAANTEVHGNYVKDFGVSPFAQFQNNGMQIGGGTSGRFYNNFIWNSDPAFEVGNGIFIQSYRDTLVAGNTLVNSDDGMYVHRDTGEDQLGQAQDHTLTVANNTVVLAPANTAGRGIWTFNDVIEMTLLNNLVVVGLPPAGVNEDLHVRRNAVYDQRTTAANQDQGLTGPNILQVSNVKSKSADALVHFLGASSADFRLQSGSPAVNAGADITGLGLTVAMAVDHGSGSTLETPRTSGAAVDAGAFERPLGAPALRFYTVAPCRLFDTRQGAGPAGGPAFTPGLVRAFAAAERCGIPAGVRAVAVNLTAVNPAAAGNFRLAPTGIPVPLASALNFRAQVTRANNAIVSLGSDGRLQVQCDLPSGSVHAVMDVVGYFN